MMSSMLMLAVLASTPVTLQYEGPLKEGIKQIAQKAELNVVVIGDLDEKAQINLNGVFGEDAIDTIAEAYDLDVKRAGKTMSPMWVIRKRSATPAPTPAATPPALPEPPAPVVVSVPPFRMEVQTGDATSETAEQMRTEAEEARESAEKLRAEADEARAKLESMRNASAEAKERAREAYDEARERAQEAADDAREKAQEAANQAREEAQEAREAARAQAQEIAEAARERAQAMREEARAKAELARSQMELQRHRVSTGGPVTVEKGTRVEAAVAYGGPVVVEEGAIVEGDAVAFGGDVVLKPGAVVDGDAVSFGGTVVREEGSVVHGESVSMGGTGFGSTVARSVVKSQRAMEAAEEEDDEESDGFGRGLAAFLAQFAVFFGLGFVLMMFVPNRMKAIEATMRAEPAKNALAGFLGLLAAVPLTPLLAVTIVGIPVAVLMWLALALAIPVGLAVVANVVGTRLPTGRVRKTQALALAIGLFALLLIGRIPVLGAVILAAAIFVSLGAIIRTRFGQPPKGTPMIDQNLTAPVL